LRVQRSDRPGNPDLQECAANSGYRGRPTGETLFSGADIRGGQEVFLKYGLMENGTIWGHGAYLGPDFSAEYLQHPGAGCQ